MPMRAAFLGRLLATAALLLAGAARAAEPAFGPAEVRLNAQPATVSDAVGRFVLVTRGDGPQVALTLRPARWVASVRPGEEFVLTVPARGVSGRFAVSAEVALLEGDQAVAVLEAAGQRVEKTLRPGRSVHVQLDRAGGGGAMTLRFVTRGAAGEVAVRWRRLRLRTERDVLEIPLSFPPGGRVKLPPPTLPPLRAAIEREMIEADWRMQDGIDTPREPVPCARAAYGVLGRTAALLRDLQSAGADLANEERRLAALRRRWDELQRGEASEGSWEDLWRRVHVLRRRIALGNPLAKVAPLLFVKRAPASFSHQLTQYYGRYARPGGGLFVLPAPGESMACRRLAGQEPGAGSYQHPEVSHDGRRVLFAYCALDSRRPYARYYHLYELPADGGRPRRLTDGPYDDFSPRYLPDGRIVFVSTRRGGFHRCGSPGCPVYTLTVANADGSGIRLLSYHETQEWDPAVLHDGRILYTRWDYVDRHAVFGEHLWTTRPDGTAPAAFYGNLTRNPVGTWEARPVPGSHRVMATAAAHHAMTSGSIVLVDPDRGCDGLAPLTRLTPDVPFPESEFPVGRWSNRSGVRHRRPDPPENRRWPGHSYRTPFPLSERYFLAAYSYAALIGEPSPNPVNMFGLYLVDRFGNKELLYRDMNISSLWPVPLRPRRRPPVLPSRCEPTGPCEGTFVLQNVYAASPPLPAGSVRRLRITQVLPKTTEGRDRPAVGLAGGAPGKQVLGTVPVEPDGSAHFTAPAGVPLLFQALDDRGQAVQVMRSATYLQPGETASCIGCHEPRTAAALPPTSLRALRRAASCIRPAPDGARPFSYPLLVQPVLDRHCVRCHSAAPGRKPPKGVVLTGEPQGHYTASYNALARRVPVSSDTNGESLSRPGRFGARGSGVMRMLLRKEKGHTALALTAEDIERLATWMDTNALFYGTFDPADQRRQQHGRRIAGPKLQ
jgi:hypothetical protein